MNRRHFLTRSSAVLGASTIGSALAPAQEPAPAIAANEAFQLLSPPVVTHPQPDAMSILWATNGPATGWIEYGETPALGHKTKHSRNGLVAYDERCFKVRLTGLTPGTRYHYRVHAAAVHFKDAYHIERKQEIRSEVFSFVTPNPAAAQASFTVWNDTHENTETLKALHQVHQAKPGDFLLWNGDITNDIYSEEKMVGQFLAPAGLPVAANVPLYFNRGNHDLRGPAARQLPRFTDVPDSRYYYAFRHGPLAALVLDTGEDKPDDHPVYAGLNDSAAFRSEQAAWLRQAIEAPEFRSAPFKILFCHIPLRWTNESETSVFCGDGRAKWHDLLVKAGVQLVISGHTHRTAWIPANDKYPYGQLIGGGPKPEAATYIRGEVSAKELKVAMHKLDGAILQEVIIKA